MKNLKIGKFNLEIPIVQGGMGVGVSLGNLAGNVAKLGGVGTISSVGIGFKEEDFYKSPLKANMRALEREVIKAKEIANGKGMIALNIMQAITDFEEFAKFAITTGIDALVVGAGLPLKLPEITKDTDVLIGPIVSSKRALQVIIRYWKKNYDKIPDFVVLEGKGAGGHLGYSLEEINQGDNLKETLEELKEYIEKENLKIPIIVGGNVNTPEKVKEFLNSGADFIQVGTRFIATQECDAHENFKEEIVKATDDDIKVVYSPVGMPGRAINNKFIKKVEELGRIKPETCINCLVPCNPKETKYCISQALITSVSGNVDDGLVFSGAGVGEINEITTVKYVVDYLLKEIR